MATKRTNEPWMTADDYGRTLPVFTVNLLVANLPKSVSFYREVLGATLVYSDPDFASLRVKDLEFMLHADHAYEHHPWHARLTKGEGRGLGAELRLFYSDPDVVEARAQQFGAAILQPSQDKPHGWRDVIVTDPDGYAWAVGIPLKK